MFTSHKHYFLENHHQTLFYFTHHRSVFPIDHSIVIDCPFFPLLISLSLAHPLSHSFSRTIGALSSMSSSSSSTSSASTSSSGSSSPSTSASAAPFVLPPWKASKFKASSSLQPHNFIISPSNHYAATVHRSDIYIMKLEKGKEMPSDGIKMDCLKTSSLVASAGASAAISSSVPSSATSSSSTPTSSSTDSEKKDYITSIQYASLSSLRLSSSLPFCILSTSSSGIVEIFDEIGQKCLAFHHMSRALSSLSSTDTMLKCITHDGNDTLLVGNESGEVLIFCTLPKKIDYKGKITVGGKGRCVWCVAYNAEMMILAVGDDHGIITLYDIKKGLEGNGNGKDCKDKEGRYSVNHSIGTNEWNSFKYYEWKPPALISPLPPPASASSSSPPFTHPTTSVIITPSFLYSSFASGHIRIHSLRSPQLLVQIAAHTRIISSLSLHPTMSNVILATSEDTFCSVWRIDEEADGKGGKKVNNVKNILMDRPSHMLLTGGQWIGKDYKGIAVVAYDSRFLMSRTVEGL